MSDSDSEIQIRFKLSTKAVGLLGLSFVLSVTLGVLVWVSFRAPDETLAEHRHGWSADAFQAEETAQIVGAMPAFQIVGENGEVIVQDNAKSNVRLWEAVVAVNGQNLPNVPQQVGDCVSWAYAHGCELLIAIEMKSEGGKEFHRIFPPYIYGTSRVLIGNGKLKGDGSCMAWACRAGQQYGILRSDADGVPGYSGSLARDWGRNGPPKQLLEAAKMFTVGTVSPIRSAAECRDALANGYPCPFGASQIGWENTVIKHGRIVGIRSGQWSHAQVAVGYDGSGPEPLFCILNSWGPRAGGKSPMQGEPDGSYWISERDMDFVARQGDCFAISGFAGFKARKIDFKLTERVNPIDRKGQSKTFAKGV